METPSSPISPSTPSTPSTPSQSDSLFESYFYNETDKFYDIPEDLAECEEVDETVSKYSSFPEDYRDFFWNLYLHYDLILSIYATFFIWTFQIYLPFGLILSGWTNQFLGTILKIDDNFDREQ